MSADASDDRLVDLVSEVEIARRAAAMDVRANRDDLAAMLREHGRRLTKVAERLENDTGSVNPLGEDQGAGARIDVACAAYRAALRHLESIERLNATANGHGAEVER